MANSGFNSQPPEGGWRSALLRFFPYRSFQLTAARRRLGNIQRDIYNRALGFNSQPPEGGWDIKEISVTFNVVSTHSRPKAAGMVMRVTKIDFGVSTHSRPKAAGTPPRCSATFPKRFNSQPPEGGWTTPLRLNDSIERFNSQPPEGGWLARFLTVGLSAAFQLTAARRRLASLQQLSVAAYRFQLTAARRRLDTSLRYGFGKPRFNSQPPEGGWVDNHAARHKAKRFNSQPPEGGWAMRSNGLRLHSRFNSQPPEGGWVAQAVLSCMDSLFQLTAARRRLAP